MAKKQITELLATFKRERHRRGEWCVLECEQAESQAPAARDRDPQQHEWQVWDMPGLLPPVTVTAECLPHELVAGLTYRFYGEWRDNPRFGRQFVASDFARSEPASREGVTRYLAQIPRCGLGRSTIEALWEQFGGRAVEVLRTRPEEAVEAVASGHFTLEKARRAAKWLEAEKATEASTLGLLSLLGGRGFPRTIGKRLTREWGLRAADLVRRNPYLLLRFKGCGFLRTDKMYLDLGGNPLALKRQARCLHYTLATNNDGHTWFPPSAVERGLREHIAGSDVRAIDAARLAKRARLIAIRHDDEGRTWVADHTAADNESYIAERIAAMLTATVCVWPNVDALDVSPHQREQLAKALQTPVAIFGGTPGTGKTYTAARVIKALADSIGLGRIAIAAPTGKAAVRLTEALNSYGVPLKARTVHSLLGVGERTEGSGWQFKHNEKLPLPHRVIVLDEWSMCDTDLFASLLRACAAGTQLLFVGDTNQLPPVGHGRPLYDLREAGVPFGELTELHRNSGQIVRACQSIRGGRWFESCVNLDPDVGDNLTLRSVASSDDAIRVLVEMLRGVRAAGLADPVWGCQVVCAVNDRSPLSRANLNRVLQGELNPTGQRSGNRPFRVGDKVVCLRNGFVRLADGDGSAGSSAIDGSDVQTNEDGEVFVANGEQGQVVDLTDTYMDVTVPAPPRTVRVFFGNGSAEKNGEGGGGSEGGDGGGEGSNTGGVAWDLAYAISCHKSQGSEWPVVFVIGDDYAGARMVQSKNWLYTAISRAKKVCVLIGQQRTFRLMLGRDAISGRKTLLKESVVGAVERIRSERAGREIVNNQNKEKHGEVEREEAE